MNCSCLDFFLFGEGGSTFVLIFFAFPFNGHWAGEEVTAGYL